MGAFGPVPRMNASRPGSASEVFATFLRLGLTSFGGPVAHIGYFRREVVERRAWMGEARFGELVGLCQFLPGPASSQLGFSVGLLRAGWPGALAAFAGFTLPSALLLFAFAMLLPDVPREAAATLTHGLKLVAVAVVAHGLVGMARQLCPDAVRALIAAAGAAATLAIGAPWIQLAVVAAGAIAGIALCAKAPRIAAAPPRLPHGRAAGIALVAAYLGLLVALPVAAAALGGPLALASGFYRAGALVFGGGHVVLPLLQHTVVEPGWISRDDFLAGYGAAQAIPGPMFTLAAYLGARIGGLAGSALATASIFLPGLLLVAGALPLWQSVARHPRAASAVAGINAAVVGLLAAALYDPVWTSAVASPADAAIAAAGFLLLAWLRAPPLAAVAWCVAAAFAASALR